jgi:hypothetical protein
MMKELKMTYATALVVRNTGTTMNPSAPKTAEFYDECQVAYLMQDNKGKLRVVTSHGALGNAYEVGTTLMLVSDSNGRMLGHFTIVGIADFATGAKYTPKGMAKEILFGRKLRHWVVK